jgi:hypothetical protein
LLYNWKKKARTTMVQIIRQQFGQCPIDRPSLLHMGKFRCAEAAPSKVKGEVDVSLARECQLTTAKCSDLPLGINM